MPPRPSETPSPGGPDDGEGPLYEPVAERLGWRQVLRSVLGLAVAVALIAFALPWVVDTTWGQIGDRLSRTSPLAVVTMAGLLLAGLYSYTFTLAASLPGLSHLRALMANAVHAMIGNLLPAGAAVGMAATYLMYRSWGFSRRAVSSSLVVTGVLNLLARLALPVVGLLVLALGPVDAPRGVEVGGAIGAAIGIALLATFVAVLCSDAASQRVGRGVERALRPLAHRRRSPTDVPAVIWDLRRRMGTVLRDGGWAMVLGLAGMFALLFALYVVAARSVGLDLSVAHLLAAYCFRQFLTIVAVTPGGLGITEAGTAGVLVAFGGDPAAAASAALLYAVFSQGLAVPLGLVAWGTWWAGHRRRA